ncbi:rhodanese-like domain-containing protein [Vibrio alginolyticus]|uniref:rhodanese-like domain-containing protein n=1 Tax=Vibrio sp. B1FLJ16 TaxID=2751178 RepID=UPI0015F4A13F|nr:rhodanese-like domain-containing protein [Vibrio sp. B1FLJ16]CAD7824169.1 COG0607 Rhodanese-related sulfurtransferase [Vibrio sp. B1FLJ16]CAE6953844.1 COG0607 Rhodanese-related sulfurtransferase [Vibrio sp. B1FLJ16]
MNKSISLLITLVVTCLVVPTTIASERAEQGWQLIEQGALVVDVRTPQEYAEGHIDNALNFPLSELDKHFKDIDKNKMIVLYCRSGNRSGKAYQYLQSQGFTNLHNAGGFEEFKHVQ